MTSLNKISNSKLFYFIQLIVLISFFSVLPISQTNAVGLSDGGMLMGINTICTCSGGGIAINAQSYKDRMSRVYLYQPGTSVLYMHYGVMKSGSYFLSTIIPYTVCLYYVGDGCMSSTPSPTGIFSQIGTSFKEDNASVLALFKELPLSSFVSNTISQVSSDLSPQKWY